MEEKLVSIIMPAYNAARFIEDAINSVQNQTYKNWELLICDDCSTDKTKKIISSFMKNDRRIKLFELEKNSGAAIARNTSIKNASGQFISFLDSDDIWKTKKLEKQIEFMKLNNYLFTCTYYDKINNKGTKLNQVVKYAKVANFNTLLYYSPGNSTVIYNSNELGKFYIPSIRKRNDYLMWFQVIQKSKYLNCLQQNLSSHRIVENSLSHKKMSLVKYHWKIYNKELRMSPLKSLYYCCFWMFKGVLSMFNRKIL